MKQKTVKITIKAPFWFRLWIAISFLKTGTFEWDENSFYDELTKALLISDTATKVFKKRAKLVWKKMEREL